jgi:dihydrofolate reductase
MREALMGRLIYSMNVSLDGFVETSERSLDWSEVDEEILGWWNDRTREADAFLYGRGVYETMSAYWPTALADPSITPAVRTFAEIWNPKPKFVFSSTLDSVDWNSELIRGDVGDGLARIRAQYDGDLDLGGATVAAEFVRRGLVDEYRVVIHPVILGGGTPFFPPLEGRIRLRLKETKRFASGAAYLGYEVR